MTVMESILARFCGDAISTFVKNIENKLPNLNGTWVYEQITASSSYNPYVGMKLQYLVLLSIHENKISGSAEKFWEFSIAGGERKYVGKNRSTATISGHVTKQGFFGQYQLVIHLNEDGHGRKYSTQHILSVVDSCSLTGIFSSTAANQIGTCYWTKRSS